MHRTLTITARAITAALLAFGAIGCGTSGGTPEVSKAKLADVVKSRLAKTVGQEPKDVTCAKNLKGKVGATARCILTAEDGTRIGVTVTATKVKGTDVHFHIAVDDHAMGTTS